VSNQRYAARTVASEPDLAALPPLLTPRELADFLQVPVKTLYQWHYLRTGPTALRIGRHLRYRRSEVAGWLASQETRPLP
jgi:excisionase family DNA binding protein